MISFVIALTSNSSPTHKSEDDEWMMLGTGVGVGDSSVPAFSKIHRTPGSSTSFTRAFARSTSSGSFLRTFSIAVRRTLEGRDNWIPLTWCESKWTSSCMLEFEFSLFVTCRFSNSLGFFEGVWTELISASASWFFDTFRDLGKLLSIMLFTFKMV